MRHTSACKPTRSPGLRGNVRNGASLQGDRPRCLRPRARGASLAFRTSTQRRPARLWGCRVSQTAAGARCSARLTDPCEALRGSSRLKPGRENKHHENTRATVVGWVALHRVAALGERRSSPGVVVCCWRGIPEARGAMTKESSKNAFSIFKITTTCFQKLVNTWLPAQNTIVNRGNMRHIQKFVWLFESSGKL